VRLERQPATADERELEREREGNAGLHVEVGGVRVAIAKGFDTATLSALKKMASTQL
jgi:hypothetical protein